MTAPTPPPDPAAIAVPEAPPDPKPSPGWTAIQITPRGRDIVQGTILLPAGNSSVSRLVVRELGQTSRMPAVKLLPAGIRSDEGLYALIPGDLVSQLGGLNAWVEYRKATWRDVLQYKRAVRMQIAVAALTLIGTVMSAVTSFIGTRSATTPTFTADVAPIALALATVGALWKLWSDVTGDLK